MADGPGSGQTLVPILQMGAKVHRRRSRAAVFAHDLASVAGIPHVRGMKTTTRLFLCSSNDTDPGLVRGAAGPALNPRAARGRSAPPGIRNGWAALRSSGRGRSGHGGLSSGGAALHRSGWAPLHRSCLRNGGRRRNAPIIRRIAHIQRRVEGTSEQMANTFEGRKGSRGS